jgi:hypothetical protein
MGARQPFRKMHERLTFPVRCRGRVTNAGQSGGMQIWPRIRVIIQLKKNSGFGGPAAGGYCTDYGLGLRLRAVGAPERWTQQEFPVVRLRFSAVIICGILCGIAGAYLSTVQAGFTKKIRTANWFHRAGRVDLYK